MSSNKGGKIHNIYLLDLDRVRRLYFKDDEKITNEIVIDKIVQGPNSKYNEQKVRNHIDTKGFDVKVLFYEEKGKINKISTFCKSFVEESEPIVTFRPKSCSSVIFIYSKKHIFAVTTGQGFRLVENICVKKFGLLVLDSFENYFKITALDSNQISSIVHSSKTIYTNEVDFLNIDNLDTIFKEVTGRVNNGKMVHELMSYDSKSKKQSVKIIAKDSVQFSGVLNFEGLINLLKILDRYNYDDLKDTFNLIVPITNKQNSSIIEENNKILIEKIYKTIKGTDVFDIDLFNKNTNTFIEADEYVFQYGNEELLQIEDLGDNSLSCIKDAYENFIVKKSEKDNLNSFIKFFNNAGINAFKGDDIVTNGNLLSHISGEIVVGEKNYYIFYGEYYLLKEKYTQRLNKTLNGKLIPEIFSDYLTLKWESDDTEDDFNLKTALADQCIFCHKLKLDNIEFADLIKPCNDKILIIHVKNGFDCNMRELERQVELSIKLLKDFKENNKDKGLRDLYTKLKKRKEGINIQKFFATVDDFLNEFKTKEIQYIIAINPQFDDLLSTQSNIAKYCLNSLLLNAYEQMIDLKIEIIKH